MDTCSAFPHRYALGRSWTGAGSLVIFAALRGLNGYGDVSPWKTWPDATRECESFLNVTKYPPSPDYVLVTLGISLLIFLVIERLHEMVSRPLTTFGRTPCLPISHTFLCCTAYQIAVGVVIGLPAAVFRTTLPLPWG